jgi:hypothetical protein
VHLGVVETKISRDVLAVRTVKRCLFVVCLIALSVPCRGSRNYVVPSVTRLPAGVSCVRVLAVERIFVSSQTFIPALGAR